MINSIKFTSLLKSMTGKKVQYNEASMHYDIDDGTASITEGAEYIHIRVAADVGDVDGWTIGRDPISNAVVSERHSPINDTKSLMNDLKTMSYIIRRT